MATRLKVNLAPDWNRAGVVMKYMGKKKVLASDRSLHWPSRETRHALNIFERLEHVWRLVHRRNLLVFSPHVQPSQSHLCRSTTGKGGLQGPIPHAHRLIAVAWSPYCWPFTMRVSLRPIGGLVSLGLQGTWFMSGA